MKIDVNSQNIKVYDDQPALDDLKNLAILAGLDSGCDVDVVSSYVHKANSILEVGASYGRVLNKLCSMDNIGEITAIECGENPCKILYEKFANKVNIIRTDIRYANLNKKFDLILLLWCSIADFPKPEQMNVLNKLKSLLTNKGILIFDAISTAIKPLQSETADNQNCRVPMGNGILQEYVPSLREIENYGKQLEFFKIKHLNYKTTTSRKRMMHIFYN